MQHQFPITIYHNSSCETSQNVLSAILASGYSPHIIHYLDIGWKIQELQELFAAAQLTPRQAMRETKSPAQELGLLNLGVSDSMILNEMCKYPILVNRPFVKTPKGVKLCRPSEIVFELLDRFPQEPLYKTDGQLMVLPQ